MLATMVLLALQAGSISPSADDQVTEVATMAFIGCIGMQATAPTRTAFIAKVRRFAEGIVPDRRYGSLVIDDVGGQGCRVSFTGTAAEAARMATHASNYPPARVQFNRKPLATGDELISITLTDPRP